MFQPVLICIGRSRYDDDGSGEIDAEELQGIMENLGVSVTEEEIEKMVLEIDEDGSGERKKKREGKSHFSSSSIYETRKERERHRDQEVVVTRIISQDRLGTRTHARNSAGPKKSSRLVCTHVSGTIDFDEFLAMVKKAMADDAGGTGSKLAMAMVEHSFAAMGDEIAWKWQRGTMVQLRNGQKPGP
jgi:hypothetical protein